MMGNISVKMEGLSVMIGITTHRDFPPKTLASLWETQKRCGIMGIPCELGLICSGLLAGRDQVLDEFLKSDCNRLFMIDSDQTWTPDQFIRLLAMSTLVPVVGATYPAKMDQPTFFVLYDTTTPIGLNEYGLWEIMGMGLGFTCIQREVIEKLVTTKPMVYDEIGKREMRMVFRQGQKDGKRQGEDMAFFEDIRALGYPVMLDPLTDIGHIGNKEYAGTIRDFLKDHITLDFAA